MAPSLSELAAQAASSAAVGARKAGEQAVRGVSNQVKESLSQASGAQDDPEYLAAQQEAAAQEEALNARPVAIRRSAAGALGLIKNFRRNFFIAQIVLGILLVLVFIAVVFPDIFNISNPANSELQQPGINSLAYENAGCAVDDNDCLIETVCRAGVYENALASFGQSTANQLFDRCKSSIKDNNVTSD